MADWTLAQPLWLLLWPSGLLLAWLWRDRLHRLSLAQLFATQVHWRHPALADPTLASPARDRPKPPWRGLLAWGCVALALAQPVRLGDPLPAPTPAVDLYVLLDTSVSMVLSDYRQDGQPVQRLAFAKGLLDRLAADFGGDRLGLYLIGSPSRRMLPATPDHLLFRDVLARVTPTLAGRRAELGDALARLADDLQGRPPDRTALALLVTDGTQPSGRLTPAAGAHRLQAAGVPLYVLSIGAGIDTARDIHSGGLLFDTARPDALAELARSTGGQGFAATDIQALQDAVAVLTARHLATTPPPERRQRPLYPWLLLGALLLLALPRRIATTGVAG